MDKLLLRLSETVGILFLIAFIIFVSGDEKISTADPEELSASVISVTDTEGLSERNGIFLKKQFSVNPEELDYFCYFSSDSVMDVREYLIVKADKKVLQSLEESISSVLEEKQTLFRDYAPEQSALLDSGVLIHEKGYLLYAVGEDSDAVLSEFRDNL